MTVEGERTEQDAAGPMPPGENGNGSDPGGSRGAVHGRQSGEAQGEHEAPGSEAGRRGSGGERFRRVAGDGLEQAASALHRAGRTVARRGGPAARASSAAHRMGAELDHAAAFVRSGELEAVREEVEHSIREHPIRSVIMATAAGYVIGRLLRW